MLSGSPETAMKWADDELRFFRAMGDADTVAKMEGALRYLQSLASSGGGGALS